MYLGRVIGTCVATRRAAGLEGVKLLVVQPLDHLGKPTTTAEVAVDTVRAGSGEHVYLVGSREAALALAREDAAGPDDGSFVPVDSAIVGIVDEVQVRSAR
jgi:ethanolamine utilization protein EutN